MATDPRWTKAFTDLARLAKATPPSRDAEGVWSVSLCDADVAPGPLLELLPGRWERRPPDPHFQTDDYLSEWVSLSERAVARIGVSARSLSATIAVAPDDRAFLGLLDSFARRPPPAWCVAFERLVSEARTDPPGLDLQGGWSVDLMGSSTPERVVAMLPGEWELVGLFEETELTMAAFACEAERGVVFTQDHFQAGLFGKVAVYPDSASYERARDEASARCERDEFGCARGWLRDG